MPLYKETNQSGAKLQSIYFVAIFRYQFWYLWYFMNKYNYYTHKHTNQHEQALVA